MDRVDKGYWLTTDYQSLTTKTASGQIVDKVAPTRSDVRFRNLHAKLPQQMRGKVLTAEGLARTHLGLLDDVGAKRATQDTLKLANVSQLRNGAQIVRFRSEVGGIEVFRGDISVLLDGNQSMRALSGVWPSVPVQALGKAVPAYRLGAEQALGHALSSYGFSTSAVVSGTVRAAAEAGYVNLTVADTLRGSTDELVHSARAKKVLFPSANRLIPAWYVETVVGPRGVPDAEYYSHVIAADSGDVLFRHNQTENEDYQYNVWAENAGFLPYPGPQGRQATPYPALTNQGLTPGAVPTEVITLANVPFSTNAGAGDPWLPNGASVTTGNNTEAYTDAGTEGFNPADGDIRGTAFPAGGPVPPAYDATLEPNASDIQRAAAVRQMFYFVNWTHDWYYDAGFDEASGNAQADNFGRGGAGSDSVKAEGQDNSNYPGNTCFPNCSNNANMSTPADGGRPRMQMFTWSPVGAASFTRLTPAPQHASGGVGTAGWNSVAFNLTDDIVQATDVAGDGDNSDGTTTDGCSAFNNAAAVNGKIAFVDRGGCGFAIKTQNAFAASASGIVIGNLSTSTAPGSMGGTPTSGLSLPALLINFDDAQDLRTALTTAPGAVTGTMLRVAGVRPDGTVDNQIMAHELGHYISNRLVHNAAGLTTNHSRGLGEGWGDFHAQLMTVKEEDLSTAFGADYAGVYGMAAYSTGNYWAGIREFPYTTNMSINPLTYGDLITRTQVHAAGEVWASSLWQCYAGILNSGLTFADAQQRMKEYLIAGYKLTPPGPFFTEARDAVLAAMIASGETADFEVCAAGFATRGAGIYAVPPNDRNGATNAGVVEDFTIDGKITLSNIGNIDDSAGSCDVDGVLDVGEQGVINLPFNNVGWLSLTDSEVQVSSDFAGLVFPDGATYTVADTVPYQSETVQIPVRLDSAPGGAVTLTFTASDPDVGTAPAPLVVPVAMNFDYVMAASDTFDTSTFDSSMLGWATREEFGATATKKWVKRTVSGAQVAFGGDIGSGGVAWLETPAIEAGPSALSVQLSHRFSFESGAEPDGNYDGGVVEISIDGGAWTALDLPEYTNTLSDCCGNPMAGRDAFTLNSAGYPAFTPLTINLGTTYNGSNVRLRFGVAEDASAAGVGWDIDTVTVTGALNQPFPVGTGPQVVDCGTNTAPVAVDDSLTVLAGGSATVLDGGATTVQANDTDAEDGVPSGTVALATGVAGGNSLTLNADGTFSYTDGTGADDSFTYTVEDSDGNVSDPATVTIVVNHAPTVAAALGDQTNDEGDVINLSLAGVFDDSDGDTLAFSSNTLPSGITIVGSALVGTLGNNASEGSVYTINVTADDGRGGTVQDSFDWTINDTEANTTPTVVSPIATQNNVEGDAINLDLASHFADADGDALSFSADVLPPGVSIVGGAITGTLGLASAGSYSVTITADDGFASGTVSAPAFTWNVAESPIVNTPANVTVAQLWVGDTAAPVLNIGNTGAAGAPDLIWTIGESTAADNCAVLSDVPWLSTAPVGGGSTAQGGTTPVTVNINTAGLTQGTAVQARLCVASNDPATPVRAVPVVITTLRPAHDLFARALEVSATSDVPWIHDTTNAQLGTKTTVGTPIDPTPSCRATFNHTHWYEFTPAEDGLLSAGTIGSTGSFTDTAIALLTYDGAAFTELACNDDIGDDPTEWVSRIEDVRVTAGETYYLYAMRFGNTTTAAAGTLKLTVDYHAFTGDAAMTINPSAISTSVPSGATTFRDVAIGNTNTGGDRPLDWEIVDESGGWALTGETASLLGPATELSSATAPAAADAAATAIVGDGALQAPPANALDVGLTLQQNNSLNVSHVISVASGGGFNIRYLRAFTLSDFGIVDDFNFNNVAFWFVRAMGSTPAQRDATVTVYQLDGDEFTYANMTQVAQGVYTPPAGTTNNPQLVQMPLTGTIEAGSTLVLEVSTPIQAPSQFWNIGYNQLGESAPGWLASDNGLITSGGQPFFDPVPLPALGGSFATNQLVMAVQGEFTCDTPTDLNWLGASALSGSVAPGTSQTVSFTLGDAGLADGNYAANLCVVSNDPTQQIRLLPVTLDVGNEMPQITVDPVSVSASVSVGGTTTQTLTIGNDGDDLLDWAIAEATSARGPIESELLDAERITPAAAAPQGKVKLPADAAMDKAGQAVQDGGFELGSLGTGDPANPFWTDASGAFPAFGVFCDGTCGGPTAHSGDNFLWFGGTASGTTDFAEQEVTIPVGAEAVLSYWILKNASPNVNFTVSIDGDVLATYTTEAFGAWTRFEVDVLDYADGGTHTLRFDAVTTGSGNVFIDDVALNYAEACDFIGDVEWLSVDPIAGTTAPGATTDVELSFDSTGLAADTYSANLCIDSNDFANPRVSVPVSFEVVYVPPTIELDPTSVDFALLSGDSASEDVTVANLGSGTPTLDWELLATSGALLEELNIGNVTTNVGGGAPVSFSVPGGVANSGTVVGFRFEGDLAQAMSSSWGTDTCMVVTAPTGETFAVGGFSGSSQPGCDVNLWEFEDAGVEGPYSSNHDDAFGTGVADAGNWTFSFTNDWATASTAIIWNNVKITLVKVQDVPAGCDLLDSVSWLSTASATSGSLGAADSDVVTLDADATGLGAGTYNANLCFVSNDPVTPVAELPVELVVAAPQLTLDPLAIDLAADVDGSDSEDLSIGNEGDADLVWTLASDEVPAPVASPLEVNIVRGPYASRGPASDAPRRNEIGTVVTAGNRVVRVPTRGTQLDVLLVTPDTAIDPTGLGPQFIVDELNNFPDINAQLNTTPVGSMTAADLASYDVVIISNNNKWSSTTPASDVAVGDALADYIDGGGKVIAFQFAYDWDTWALAGRFMTGNYGPFTVSTTDSGTDVTMVANEPSSPLLAGVSTVGYTGLHQNVGLQPGAELIASWSNGSPFVAANENVVAINALYAGSDETTGEPFTSWTGDLDVLLHNAVVELAGPQFCVAPVSVPWLTATPANGTTIPGATSVSAISANATGLAVGTYTANLCVASNDPANPLVVVPVSLTVSQNAPPVLTAAATANYAENGTAAVLTASATDAEDAAGDLTFQLTGADANLFVFDPASGDLDFLASPDFEAPADAGANNVYNVILTVSDTEGLSDSQAIAITVTDVNEAPVVNDQAFQVDVNAAGGTVAGTIAYTDQDAGGSHTVASTGGTGTGVFAVTATGEIIVLNSAALTDGSSFTLNVTVTDNGGLTDTAVITITVDSDNDAPVAGTVADVSVQFGTVVSIDAGAAFTDPDGDTLAFALSSVPGLPASLDFDTATGVISGTPLEADIGSYEITVTATDPDGEEASVTFTLNVVGERIFGDGFED